MNNHSTDIQAMHQLDSENVDHHTKHQNSPKASVSSEIQGSIHENGMISLWNVIWVTKDDVRVDLS
jgi:hypothetical protein